MDHEITIGWGELLKQAHLTAHDFFLHAIDSIDEKFGDGFAKKNPELLAAVIQASSYDFRSSTFSVAAQKLDQCIDGIAEAIRNLKPQ